MSSCFTTRFSSAATALIALGAILRIARYLHNRSLWLDEVFLANNLRHRPFAGLLKPLDYRQGAGVGFLLLCKSAISIFGTSELALRLVPLMAGLASLPLFYLLARRLLDERAAMVALILMVCVEPLIYYSSEIKQYSTDVAVTLAILLAVMRYDEQRGHFNRALTLAIVGVVGIFLSHPAVFALAVAGLLLIRSKRWDVPLFVVLFSCAVAVAVNYVIFLRPLVASQGLQKHWADMGGYPPASWKVVEWFYHRFLGVFGDYATMWLRFDWLGIVPARIAAVLSALGFVSLARSNRKALVVIGVPIAITVLAAAMREYPFEDRLILFLVPMFIVTIAQGAWAIWNGLPKWGRPLPSLMLAMVVIPTAVRAADYLIQPPGREEIKPVLAYLSPRLRDTDVLYLYHAADAPYLYYRQQFHIPDRQFVMGSRPTETAGAFRPDIEKVVGSPRVWILFSHVWDTSDGGDEEEALLQRLDQRGKRVEEFQAEGASVYLYDLKTSATQSGAH